MISVAGVPLFRADRPMGGLTWWAEVSRLGTVYRATGRVYEELAELAEELEMARKKSATTTLPKVTEADVMSQVADALRVHGLVDVHRNNTGGGHFPNADGTTRYVAFGQAGNADYSGMIPAGTTSDGTPRPALKVDIEVKRPGEWPRPNQIARLIRTNANGGIGFWVTDGEAALNVLRRVMDGWSVIVTEDGNQWLDDGKD